MARTARASGPQSLHGRRTGLRGAEDSFIAETCRREQLCLITADVDFAQVFEFPPDRYHGLIVLRHPRPTLAGMRALIQQVAVAVQHENPTSRLWIVEPGRIRIHEPGAGSE